MKNCTNNEDYDYTKIETPVFIPIERFSYRDINNKIKKTRPLYPIHDMTITQIEKYRTKKLVSMRYPSECCISCLDCNEILEWCKHRQDEIKPYYFKCENYIHKDYTLPNMQRTSIPVENHTTIAPWKDTEKPLSIPNTIYIATKKFEYKSNGKRITTRPLLVITDLTTSQITKYLHSGKIVKRVLIAETTTHETP